MNIDLHCHSHFSDGQLAPDELLQRAYSNGVRCLSITDHDTLGAYQSGPLFVPSDMTLIPGIEMSAEWAGRNIHIVGLDVNPDDIALLSAVDSQQQVRIERAEQIARRLQKLGAGDLGPRARELANGASIGRPHFAHALVEAGVVRNVKEAFRKYLGTGKPGDVRNLWPSLATATNWINAAGGIAVLAHPGKYKLTRTKLNLLLDEFTAAGGRAMEVISGSQTDDETRKLAGIAAERQLLASCGSDFHRPDMQWSDLGRFPPLPASCEPVWAQWNINA